MYTFAVPKSSKMNYRKEHIIYTLMWIVLFLSPVIGLYMRMSTDIHVDFSWREIFNAWKFYSVWLVLFAIHNFFLTPILILKRRTWLYTSLSFILLTAAMTTLWFIRPVNSHRHGSPYQYVPELLDLPSEMPPPQRLPELEPTRMMPVFGPGEIVTAIVGLLLMGMNLGVKLYFKSQEDSKALIQMERHALERQLQYLKYQVNPHFFMNTLNNIHALVDIDPERAKTTILELSKMMRYVLYEGTNRLVPLPREVQFLRNYVQLMSLRYNNRVQIRLDTPTALPDRMLPPLLLIIFVENAFKHGISYRTDSYIYMSISTQDDRLMFSCRNSRTAEPSNSTNKKEGGMGLKNVQRRLDLLFPQKYKLEISNEEKEYGVYLNIPLS